MKNLFSPALHTTTFCALSSAITQDLDLHIIFIDHPFKNPTPIFSHTPTPANIVILSSNSVKYSSNDWIDRIPQNELTAENN